MSIGTYQDPRTRLVREKYFSLRPKPLERWLWQQGVPPAAERVFWLHWQEGQQRGDWCSTIPLRRVALECQLDVSTVTRAYQVLQRMGCVRRTDPGRDPANPFHQATALTEVRVPRELLVELDRHPSRRATSDPIPPKPVETPPPAAATPVDPFAGVGVRDRLHALGRLTALMSDRETQAYRGALNHRQSTMTFDEDSRLAGEARATILQVLAAASAQPAAARRPPGAPKALPAVASGPRQLTLFELARLKRDVQGATSSAEAPELVRQITWSIEEGALRKFSPGHALHIALKKLREGAWTRPHRMPPNWLGTLRPAAHPETCRRA